MKSVAAILLTLLFASGSACAATVFITGSDRGIGLEFARQYAESGWDVIATVRNPEEAGNLKALAASHENLVVDKLDVSSDADIQAIAAKYKGKPIDLLINNAGILGAPESEVLGKLDRKEFHNVMDVNVFGALAVSQALSQNVAASSQKKIVALSSGLGSITSIASIAPGATGPYYYRISKAALDMGMQLIGANLKPQGVTVAVISPGPVDTDMLAAYRSDFNNNSIHGLSPAEAVAKVIAVIGALDRDKAGKGILLTDNSVTPW